MNNSNQEPAGVSSGDASAHVRSIEKTLAVIEAFSAERAALTLSEVARLTGMTRASARRILLTLEHLGYVGLDGRLFSLRPRILKLGYAYLSTLPLRELALDGMRELVRRFEESCSLAVIERGDIIYVARIPTSRIMTITLAVGARLPAYCTSLGRVLLAGLPEPELEAYLADLDPERLTPYTVTDPAELRARIAAAGRQGWAIVDQEREIGVRSVAVPIAGPAGDVVAAMNVSVHASRVELDRLEREFLPALRQVADDLSGALRAASA